MAIALVLFNIAFKTFTVNVCVIKHLFLISRMGQFQGVFLPEVDPT